MRELTFTPSDMPDEIHVTGYAHGRRFTTTIKVAAIVNRTVGEAQWRKGRKVEPYFGNIITKMATG